VDADDKSIVLGGPTPAFTVSYDGFVNGEGPSVLGGAVAFEFAGVSPTVYGPSATPPTGVGVYLITPSGLTSSNYALMYTSGTFQIQYATGSCLGSPGRTILQPINANGTSVFKKNSTVPAKFRVCDAFGNSIGAAGVVHEFKLVTVKAGTALSSVNEVVDSTTPFTEFRWDSSERQWIFNINTKPLTVGKTYVYKVTLNDGTSFTFEFGVK
jgi:hypothetical protein